MAYTMIKEKKCDRDKTAGNDTDLKSAMNPYALKQVTAIWKRKKLS
jgi:hypothetical protein